MGLFRLDGPTGNPPSFSTYSAGKSNSRIHRTVMAEYHEHNDAYSIRVHMTFSERANPALVAMLRGLAPRAQSRLIRTLVERGLTVNLVPLRPPPTRHRLCKT